MRISEFRRPYIMTKFVLPVVILLFVAMMLANAEAKNIKDIQPEALYMLRGGPGGRTRYRRRHYRPGKATKTHSCNWIRAVPERLRSIRQMPPNGIPRFYQKYTEAYGIPVITSSNVADDALRRACYTLRFVLADRADFRQAAYKYGGRVTLIAKVENTTDIPELRNLGEWWNTRTRALGATPATPISTGAEENALCHEDDRWRGDDLVLHEYLHLLHRLGINHVYPAFQTRTLTRLYNAASEKLIWNGTYAMDTPQEYFAESGQSYHNSHMVNSPHNFIGTRRDLRYFDSAITRVHDDVFPCGNYYIPPCLSGTSAQRRAVENAQTLKLDCGGASDWNLPCYDSIPSCHDLIPKSACRIPKFKRTYERICKKYCNFCD